MKKHRYMNRYARFPAADDNALSQCMTFIETALRDLGTDQKRIMKTLLVAEEVITHILEQSPQGEFVSVRIRRLVSDVVITLRAAGEELDLFHEDPQKDGPLEDLETEDAQRAIRAILLNSLGDNLKVSHKKGVNQVRILTGQADKSMLMATVASLVLGIAFGLLMMLVFPVAVSEGICTYFLSPVKTMFMNALKIIVSPVVFFSIVTCISQFPNIAELGRIGAKVMGMYLMTTLIAVLLAMGLSLLIHPGAWGFALSGGVDADLSGIQSDVDTSLLHLIVNIVPANFVRPFLESNTMQLIFLAVVCGIAVGMIGEYSSTLKDLFEACNSLFLTITTLICRFIPLAVFCSVALMILELGGSSLLSVLGLTGTQILCILCMMSVYGILIFVIGRLNPFVFFKKNREGMITGFTLMSSSAAMPTNMKTCTEKLGISPKVSNFSIPLGSTVNMDGTCIMLTIFSLFLARAYGIAVPGTALVTLGITNILLSMGTPAVPGAGLVCLSVVLASIGVPVEAVGLVMGIYPVINMFNTMNNTTGDVAVSLIVASSEGLLDKETYNS